MTAHVGLVHEHRDILATILSFVQDEGEKEGKPAIKKLVEAVSRVKISKADLEIMEQKKREERQMKVSHQFINV